MRVEGMFEGGGFRYLLTVIIFLIASQGNVCARDNTAYFPVVEDILLNIPPIHHDFPSYEGLGNILITAFNPESEYLYEQNLKLANSFTPLTRIDPNYWVNPDTRMILEVSQEKGNQVEFSTDSFLPDKKWSEMWKYHVPSSNLTEYYFGRRQWIKKYEEFSVGARFYGHGVLTRNQYRMFYVDAKTGKLLWSFSNDKKRQELYQTSFSPHQNPYGNGIIIVQDRAIAELSGKLVVLDLSINKPPSLIWEKSLGEFSLCAEPVVNKNTVIVFLINTRHEISAAGFDFNTGEIQWSAFIGYSGFLSPTSSTSAIKGDVVFMGLNHGVLVALNARNGSLYWMRKYQATQHNILDYWVEHYAPKEKIPFDTSFINIDEENNLQYKPRESKYLYLINAVTGAINQEVDLEKKDAYLLCVQNKTAFFLSRKSDAKRRRNLFYEDLISGQVESLAEIPDGEMQGVLMLGKDLLLKVGGNIYSLKISKKDLQMQRVFEHGDGWLVSALSGSFLLAKDQDVYLIAPEAQRKEPEKQWPGSQSPVEVNEFDDNISIGSRMSILNTEPPAGSADYKLSGGNLKVVPVQVIRGQRPLNFYLLTSFNQLLCVKDDKTVAWERKFFVDDEYNRIETRAYLMDDVLVFVDLLNVLAVDVNNGKYLWSFFRNPLPRIRLDSTMQVCLIGNDMLLAHDDQILLVNIKTGAVIKQGSTGLSDADSITFDQKHYYVFSKKDKRINVLDKSFRIVASFNLDVVGEIKSAFGFFCVNDTLVIHFDATLLVLNKSSGKQVVRDKVAQGAVVPYGSDLLFVEPFKNVRRVRVTSSGIITVWEQILDSTSQILFRKDEDNRDHSEKYFLIEDAFIMPYKKEDSFYMRKINVNSGKTLWDVEVNRLGGLIFLLSQAEVYKGGVYFHLSTSCHHGINRLSPSERQEDKVRWRSVCFQSAVRTDFLGLDMDTGRIVHQESLDSFDAQSPKIMALSQTEKYFVFVLSNVALFVKEKALHDQ